MLCPNCGHENSADALFCEQCAEELLPTCPNCKQQNNPGARFCRFCRAALEFSSATAPNTPVVSDPSPDTRESAPSQPESFDGGRYVVSKFLGEGGKKLVYLAHDERLDRDVAFALIKTEGLDEVSRTRISREAQAMGRLGSHPHIVTVFELGDHEGQPYMVTELMGGGDVESIVEDAPDHKLPLNQLISIALETCKGLEFAHSRDIVHRDLKPGNVWLTDDGTAKIGDFGLAVATDRSRLTQEGMMVGTASYMPPEQAMGSEISPKADLYSLGAMLYEMVCGRPPFLGDDSISIIGQHINTPPVAPTWHRQDCPRPLEALILRLLAKDPSERPASASDVITALEAIDLSVDVGAHSEKTPDDEQANVLDSLAGDVFVGRRHEMDTLKAALEDALSGKGRMVTLVGEPGIGKTRTAQELATYAGLRGAQVLWGRCYEEQGVPPYWPWVQAIRSYVRESEPERLLSEMGAGAADIAEVVSDVKMQLPDLEPPPQLDSPEHARFRLFDSITAFLRTASQRRPIMLVIDDLHWSDQPSLMLLQFVARELSGARLLLVGTYRDTELTRQHPLAETLGELTRERLFERVLLRGLTLEDVTRFIEVTSGIVPPQTLAQAVHTQTEGNPLFVTEVVRLLVQEGELTAQNVRERDSSLSASGGWEIRVPEGVREVLGRRLNRLSQRCNETLTMASVIGREFTLEQLDRLIEDLTSDMLLDVLEEGLTAKVIEELPIAVGRYQFTHALIQETLVDELSLTRRVRLHARIAEMLEELWADNVEAHAADLAHHFALAETLLGPEKLVRYSILAGNQSLADYANEEALSLFERAMAAKEGALDEEKAAIHFGIGRALVAMSRDDAIHHLSQAFEYFSEAGELAKAVSVVEAVFPISDHMDEVHMVENALALVPPDSLEAARILPIYAMQTSTLRLDYEGAQEALKRALASSRLHEDTTLELRTVATTARVEAQFLHFQKSLEASLQAIGLAGRARDLHSESSARDRAAQALINMGEPQEAFEHAQIAVSLARRTRNRWQLAGCCAILGFLHYHVGDWDTARRHFEESLEVLPGDPDFLAFRAMPEYQTGEFAQGKPFADQSIDAIRPSMSTHTPGFNYHAAVNLAIVGRITGELVDSDVLEATMNATLSSSTATPEMRLIAGSGLALISEQQSRRTSAQGQYTDMQIARHTFATFISGDRVLGLLAYTMGDFTKAAIHFEETLTFCRKAGYRPELAWSLCDYADILLERDEEGDKAKATSLLEESLKISGDLGMRPLMERVLSRREILKA